MNKNSLIRVQIKDYCNSRLIKELKEKAAFIKRNSKFATFDIHISLILMIPNDSFVLKGQKRVSAKKYKDNIIKKYPELAIYQEPTFDNSDANKNKQDINKKDVLGMNILMFASVFGHHSSVEYFISAGADVNAKDNHEKTALMMAAQLGNYAIVNTLINAGADVNVKDIDGATALEFAIRSSKLKVVSSILKAGANINSINASGKSALYYVKNDNDRALIEDMILQQNIITVDRKAKSNDCIIL